MPPNSVHAFIDACSDVVRQHDPHSASSLCECIDAFLELPSRLQQTKPRVRKNNPAIASLTVPSSQDTDPQAAAACRRAMNYIRDNRLSKAASALFQDPLPAVTEDIISELKRLHPPAPTEDIFPALPTDAPMIEIKAKHVLAALDRLNKDSSPGVSGLSTPVAKLAATRDPKVLNFLVTATEKMVNAVPPLPPSLLYSRLTAAAKKSGGIRPIASGETLYKIACSCVLDSVKDALSDKFAGIQYALGTKGGAESIVHCAQAWSIRYRDDPSKLLISVDFANAFNSVSRLKCYQEITKDPDLANMTRLMHWAYSGPSSLFISDEKGQTRVLSSESGVRQGCPLGMAAFCIGTLNMYKKVRNAHPVDLKAYADDPIIKGDASACLDALEMLEAEAKKELGISTNKHKSKFYFPAARSLADIREGDRKRIQGLGGEIQIGCVEILGVTIGCDFEKMSRTAEALVQKKVDKLSAACAKSKTLPLHHTWTLVKRCYSQQMNYMCRSIPPQILQPAACLWDETIRRIVSSIADFDIRDQSMAHTQLNFPAQDNFPGFGLPFASNYSGHAAWTASVIESISDIHEEGSLPDLFACNFSLDADTTSALGLICGNLNWAVKENSFAKLNIVPPDFEFTDNSIISTFLNPPEPTSDEKSARPRRRKLQRALTHALHEKALTDFLQQIASDLDLEDDAARDLHLAHKHSVCARDSSLFLNTVPTDRRSWIPDDAFRFALRSRLALPLVDLDQIPERCFCSELLTDHPFTSYHFLYCQHLKGGPRYAMHQNINTELKKYTQDSGIHSTTNSSVFVSNPNNRHPKGKRPDLLIYLPRGYARTAVDVSLTCPLAPSYYKHHTKPLVTAALREQRKNSLYLQFCKQQGLSFSPFVLEVFGGLGDAALSLLETIFKASRIKCSMKAFRRTLHITLIHSLHKMFNAMLDLARAQPHVSFRQPRSPPAADSEPDLKHVDPAPDLQQVEPHPSPSLPVTDHDLNCTQPSSPGSPLGPSRALNPISMDSPDAKDLVLDLIGAPSPCALSLTVSEETNAALSSLPLESQDSALSPPVLPPASEERENSDATPSLPLESQDSRHPHSDPQATRAETEHYLSLASSFSNSQAPPPPEPDSSIASRTRSRLRRKGSWTLP